MSAKEGQKGGDSLESTGDLVQEPGSQEREGTCKPPNSVVAGSPGMQSCSSHEASGPGQEPGSDGGAISSNLWWGKVTVSLTSAIRQNGKKQKKEKKQNKKKTGSSGKSKTHWRKIPFLDLLPDQGRVEGQRRCSLNLK